MVSHDKILVLWHIILIPETYRSRHCHETPQEKKNIRNVAEQLIQMPSNAETILKFNLALPDNM